jgi:hypothetical protein
VHARRLPSRVDGRVVFLSGLCVILALVIPISLAACAQSFSSPERIIPSIL